VKLEARWGSPQGALEVVEPESHAIAAAAGLLAAFYNEPHNSRVLGNTIVFSDGDVLEFWRASQERGGRAFLFVRDGVVIGDGDFRNLSQGAAELALLVGPRELQGIGLGARFLVMLLTLGFEALSLERVYVAIRSENAASLRLFEREGFVCDDGRGARAYAEEDGDVCMRIDRAGFLARHAAALREIVRTAIA
jgi:RimJ/RimL family protein N-acetyltransferase